MFPSLTLVSPRVRLIVLLVALLAFVLIATLFAVHAAMPSVWHSVVADGTPNVLNGRH